ncbi:glycosyltransferase family 4 protein [Acidobacteria bacterium AH-259-A15]|nr:glycosyltransferase family 4 protein [Acidobacteria bacterium AH-259-A15]
MREKRYEDLGEPLRREGRKGEVEHMKIGVVVQRYGEEVVGGAERVAREVSERLAVKHEVEVITTCAMDYRNWANYFQEGISGIKSVPVRRFRVQAERDWVQFGRFSRILFAVSKWISVARLERKWIHRQGPLSPDLVNYLRTNKNKFDVFLFFTYLYYPTAFGLPKVAEKSVLVPLAHEEPAIRLSIMSKLFELPRHFIFMTREETDLVHRLFHNQQIPYKVIGTGVELQDISLENDGYLLYAGRIESGKNCEELFDFCLRARVDVKLVGPAQMSIPEHVQYYGVVSEEEKQKLLARSKALITSSRKESLSIAVLEAWAHGKPVIVPRENPVLKGQVERAGGGYCYGDFEDFKRAVAEVDPAKGLSGRKYVERNYSWDSVMEKYESVLTAVKDMGASGHLGL